MNVTAWQGGGSVIDPLEKVAPGVYRTTEPIPVYGGWKSTLRIQQGDALVSMPLFMPEDEAIPAPEVAREGELHPRVPIGQERPPARGEAGRVGRAHPDRVSHRAAIALSLIALISWSLLRVDRGEAKPTARPGRTRRARAELV